MGVHIPAEAADCSSDRGGLGIIDKTTTQTFRGSAVGMADPNAGTPWSRNSTWASEVGRCAVYQNNLVSAYLSI